MEVVSVNNVYASGGRRLVAWMIDSLIVSAVLTAAFWWLPDVDVREEIYDAHQWGFNLGVWLTHFSAYKIVKFVIATLYFAYMESGTHQATLGKLALGIKVADHNGGRISFSKAMLRNLSKVISGLIFCIGYIMIVFDARKQGLHDKIADTYVVRQ